MSNLYCPFSRSSAGGGCADHAVGGYPVCWCNLLPAAFRSVREGAHWPIHSLGDHRGWLPFESPCRFLQDRRCLLSLWG